MTVRLLYFAALRDLFGRSEDTMQLAQGSTLAELASQLQARVPGLGAHLKSLAWGVNFEFSPVSTVLNDGDEVALLPPVSGGLT